MIVEKKWRRYKKRGIVDYQGWFLFGIIPLYIRRFGIRL